jgi:hypothetical protein
MLRNPGFSAWSESILSSTPLQCQPYSASKKTAEIPTLQCFKKPFEKTSFHIYTGPLGCLELRLEGYEFVLLEGYEYTGPQGCLELWLEGYEFVLLQVVENEIT